MERSIKVVVIEPDTPARITDICGDLESMQAVVGGYIQIIPAYAIPGGKVLSRELILVLNEEGKLEDLPHNFRIWDGADSIVGTCFVCKEKNDEMVGLSEEEANRVVSLFNGKGHADG